MKAKYFRKVETVTYENYWCNDIENTIEALSAALDKEIFKYINKHKSKHQVVILGNDNAEHNDITNTYTITLRRFVVEERLLLDPKQIKPRKKTTLSQKLTNLKNAIKNFYNGDT